VQLLVARGADVNAQTSEKMTPLHRAAALGDTRSAEVLVGHATVLKATDAHGRTALQVARHSDHREVAEFLAQPSARPLKQRPIVPRNPYAATLLAWLVPGSGYFYLGLRKRGAIVCVTICIMFLLGVLLGGVEMIGPQHSKPWFIAQVLVGLPALLAVLLQNASLPAGFGRGIDLAQLYTGVAGLLNLVCVLDVLMRLQTAGPTKETKPEK